MTGVLIRTCAKVNLCLRVRGKRPDGYHDVQTVVQAVGLWDCLSLSPLSEARKITLQVSGETAPADDSNLCWRAAQLFASRTNVEGGLAMELRKSIPVGAGLGGGSSDAAACLAGLASLHSLEMAPDTLETMAAELGADVPFFLGGGCCLGRGRGEQIEPLPAPPLWLVIVVPEHRVPTGEAYAALGRGPADSDSSLEPAVQHTIEALEIGTPEAVAGALHNDFEDLDMPGLAEAREAKAALLKAGCLGASVTGSGSGTFGIAADRQSAQEVSLELRKRWPRVHVTRTLQAGEGMAISNLPEAHE